MNESKQCETDKNVSQNDTGVLLTQFVDNNPTINDTNTETHKWCGITIETLFLPAVETVNLSMESQSWRWAIVTLESPHELPLSTSFQRVWNCCTSYPQVNIVACQRILCCVAYPTAAEIRREAMGSPRME